MPRENIKAVQINRHTSTLAIKFQQQSKTKKQFKNLLTCIKTKHSASLNLRVLRKGGRNRNQHLKLKNWSTHSFYKSRVSNTEITYNRQSILLTSCKISSVTNTHCQLFISISLRTVSLAADLYKMEIPILGKIGVGTCISSSWWDPALLLSLSPGNNKLYWRHHRD